MEKKYTLKGLDCANCAQKIENAVKKLPEVQKAEVNFATTELKITSPDETFSAVEEKIKKTVKKVEPDIIMTEKQHLQQKKSSQATTDHEHHHGQHAHLFHPLLKIGIAFIGLIVMHFLSLSFIPTLIIYLILYLLVGYDVVFSAFRNLFQGMLFDENFLMAVATIGAFSIRQFPEAVAVMLFYQLGEYFQDLAVENSRKSITSALSLRPEIAHIKKGDQIQTVLPHEVNIGDVLVVKPGEKVPLDGTILEGEAYFDTSALTGESVPKKLIKGQTILSGMVNTSTPFTMTVTKDDAHSTATKILELVENASSQKAPSEKFITKFARYYTPVVVLLAVLLASIPPLFFHGAFQTWLYRALTFLVISCPCALVISVPLSFFAGIGGASKHGVIIKGSQYLENLAQLQTVIFDKTGTLTKGNFVLTHIQTAPKQDKSFLLQLAASLEQNSNHPIAKVILHANKKEKVEVKEVTEIAGFGLKGYYNEKEVFVGNYKLMEQQHIDVSELSSHGTLVYVAYDKQYLGALTIEDEIKPEAKQALLDLKQQGIQKTMMLTGDTKQTGQAIGTLLHLDQVNAQLLPQDKVAALEKELSHASGKVAFVGDGMNDAPVLARADVGIAMGALGSDAAIEASDVVIMKDDLNQLPIAVSIAKKTMRLVKENIIFALGVKGIVLLLGALGYAPMALAVFADVGVTLLAILNALRALKQ